MFGFGGDSNKKDAPLEGEKLKNREDAIRELLTLCASKEVEVPDYLRRALLGEDAVKELERGEDEEGAKPVLDTLISSRAKEISEMDESDLMKQVRSAYENFRSEMVRYECRVIDGSYKVTKRTEVEDVGLPKPSSHFVRGEQVEEDVAGPPRAKQDIQTVVSQSPLALILRRVVKCLWTKGQHMKEETKVIAEGINLHFEEGKMYLVLGLPGSGKSTVLKMIANTLHKDKNHVAGGKISVNGMTTEDKDVIWSNISAHIDQIDRLHPYLTVWETLTFSWKCRHAGTHKPPYIDVSDPELKERIQKMDEEQFVTNIVLEGLGLMRVKDTFVGDSTSIRGVSGGEKKRVTVGEFVTIRIPVLCMDEISTGLDAATTYDIVKLTGDVARLSGTIKIVSLLQPPPETVALFDELILVDAGRILYAGPVSGVVGHFEALGYKLPERTDVADWLLALPTDGGRQFLADENGKHLTPKELKEEYDKSTHAQLIRRMNEAPLAPEYNPSEAERAYFGVKYHNTWYQSLRLLVGRELLLWWRDKYQIRARLMQDLIMGIVAGTVFWQQSDDPSSVMGILFQSMFFISVGAMLKVPTQFEPRGIFYKQQDANFFPTWTFVAGRSLAGFPTSIIDGLLYGTIIYWFVGLSSSDGPKNYFLFMLLVLMASLTAGLVFSIFSATVKDKVTAQACMSITIIMLVLFSGFTVQPDVIPNYWIWVYWINFFGWILRGLVVNEFTTSKYDVLQPNGMTVGENVLILFGFKDANGDPYTTEWVWWGILFALAACVLSVACSTFFLSFWRFETGKSLVTDVPDIPEDYKVEEIELPFQRANLTFKDVRYTVKASTSDEILELLKGVDGFVEAGKMTALMGSSGAGKTTLMDCLSLRKTTGTITGEVCLNGHPQEPKSFRRCTGYVEQFDVQSPALTIRETIEFSAKLRLEDTDPAVNDESIRKVVDQTLQMLELTTLQDLQVGSDLTGGLSFEQKKRLSIAVELVANPSILFLDEPTSGLDARAASIVMRGLKRIALTGRAVCCTIHQPSIAIFNDFDSLLLLKRGGEVVFFGELGHESSKLIEYLERYEDTPKIQSGENPATWMLTCIGAGSATHGGEPFDYAEAYKKSKLREVALTKIDELNASKSVENQISFPSEYATSRRTQMREVAKRVMKIYWRSPSYNTIRIMVSAIVALLFGSVYASQRVPTNESDMNSRVTSIYITFLFLAVNSFNTVLAVFEVERNMFYRHKNALMYNETAVIASFSFAEIPFILFASMIFCVCFYFLVGFSTLAYKFFLYYLFFTLNMGCFTFLGQMMVALVRDSQTAQGFGGIIVGLTSLFAGLLIRPQNISGFWVFAYWLLPGHYILEGLVASQFYQDTTPIAASQGSPFYNYLVTEGCDPNACVGTAEQWIFVSFGGKFAFDHLPWNFLYLLGLFVAARIICFVALVKFNYLTK